MVVNKHKIFLMSYHLNILVSAANLPLPSAVIFILSPALSLPAAQTICRLRHSELILIGTVVVLQPSASLLIKEHCALC